jgi:hypothetical protein
MAGQAERNFLKHAASVLASAPVGSKMSFEDRCADVVVEKKGGQWVVVEIRSSYSIGDVISDDSLARKYPLEA